MVGIMFSKLIFKFLNCFRKKELDINKINLSSENKSTIGIIKLGFIGDLILITPFLKEIKRVNPYNRIILISFEISRALFLNDKNIDGIIHYPFFETNSIKGLLKSKLIREILHFKKIIREEKIDIIICLNRLFSFWGTMKLFLIVFFSRAKASIGFDTMRRGFFFNIRITDGGFLLKHEIDSYLGVLRLFNIQPRSRKPYLFTNTKDKLYIDELLNSMNISNYNLIFIHPGGGENFDIKKRWPLCKFVDLIQEIFRKDNDTKIILVGGNNEKYLAEKIIKKIDANNKGKIIDLIGKLTLQQLAYLFKYANIFIGNDSGPAHVASINCKNVITIFGFTDFIGFRPWNSLIVVKRLKCNPCIYSYKWKKCLTMDCINKIEVEDIMKLIEKRKLFKT